MITQDAFTAGSTLLETIIRKMDGLNKKRSEFIVHILMLILGMRGRINFMQLQRQGEMSEKSYRNQFEKPFDWLNFNKHLIAEKCGTELILGFDPSFIKKSGKSSPNLGYFYSGCSSSYKRGMEIGNFAVIDVQQNTAYHLLAVPTPSTKKNQIEGGKSLVDHYAQIAVDNHLELEQISKILVCDGYFAKKKYVNAIVENTGFELISRLRDDADLKYIFKDEQNQSRGRPKKYDGKVDVKKIDKRRFKKEISNDEMTIYSAELYSVGLKRIIKVAYVEFNLVNGKIVTKLFFSTKLDRTGVKMISYYRARYQMEFIFRDAKQFTGLEHCQARSENKLSFHFNATLSAISVGKAILRSGLSKTESIALSIQNVKTELQNRKMLKLIFSIYGFDQSLIKLNAKYSDVLNIGKIAA